MCGFWTEIQVVRITQLCLIVSYSYSPMMVINWKRPPGGWIWGTGSCTSVNVRSVSTAKTRVYVRELKTWVYVRELKKRVHVRKLNSRCVWRDVRRVYVIHWKARVCTLEVNIRKAQFQTGLPSIVLIPVSILQYIYSLTAFTCCHTCHQDDKSIILNLLIYRLIQCKQIKIFISIIHKHISCTLNM